MKRALVLIFGIVLVLAAVMLVRTGRQTPPSDALPVETIAVDGDAAIERFAGALRIPTISHGADSGQQLDEAAFTAFRHYLENRYPRVHASLDRDIVAGHSYLFTWRGSDPSLAPVILMGHHDVVPVDPEALERWTHPPFAGVVADGYLWGRGAIDDKVNVISQLEAAEALLGTDFAPERTVMMSFGHDEELGGPEGATGVVALLKERGVRAALVVDEGGAIAEGGVLPGLDRPMAAVGIAEKGYVSVEMVVETAGGHSSIPPRHTAVGILATAIHRLERNPMPSHFAGPLRGTLEAVGPEAGFGVRFLVANLWLLQPAVERVLQGVPTISPMLRTTTAATIFQAGVKDNVLPNKARAVVNFRVFPGDTIDDVVEHVRRVVDDERIVLTPSEKRREASSVTATDGEAFALLRRTILDVYPDVVVTPYLITGGTDARHFRAISDGVFGFMPVRAEMGDIRRAHGNDERIATDAFVEGIGFYARLMQQAGAWR
jgi:carboxypeptidase PM20D1